MGKERWEDIHPSRIVSFERYALQIVLSLVSCIIVAAYIVSKAPLLAEAWLFGAFLVLIPTVFTAWYYRCLDSYEYRDFIADKKRKYHEIEMFEQRASEQKKLSEQKTPTNIYTGDIKGTMPKGWTKSSNEKYDVKKVMSYDEFLDFPSRNIGRTSRLL